MSTALATVLPAPAARAADVVVNPAHPPSDEKTSSGTVTIGGHPIDYMAIAGTLTVHPKGWDDAAKASGDKDEEDNPTAQASMFYVAYFRKGAPSDTRPITFVFNGGPGSASVWLHMGAFGPRRVVTSDASHTPAAPYRLVDNGQSLLDATDLVFIDAPGTGFGRISGKDKEKQFWGVDQDGRAFTRFITQFLSKFDRWNSPKYLFGESYGTPRSAVVANVLAQDEEIDLNGVILLSQILSFDINDDDPHENPGVDLPYILSLPTYAATAWYHHKLPGNPRDLQTVIHDAEIFADTDYTLALAQGAALPPDAVERVAERLHELTGLPVDYLKKANLRVDDGMFEKELLGGEGSTTGRFDTRFQGPSYDPLAKEARYDPQSAAISSAYVSAFNHYVRHDLGYGAGLTYRPDITIDNWDWKHHQPTGDADEGYGVNVMPDLAFAMTYNPGLKVMLNAGYFDLATPFYEGIYEMRHLPMARSLQANIELKQYESGHMVYAHLPALQQLHDNVADFIRRTETAPAEKSHG